MNNKTVNLVLSMLVFTTLFFSSCKEEGVSPQLESQEIAGIDDIITYNYLGEEFTVSYGEKVIANNPNILEILKHDDLTIFDPYDKDDYFYIFINEENYVWFLEERINTNPKRKSSFSGYGPNLYLRMGDANAFDSNYALWPEIDLINDNPALEYPYNSGVNASTPNEHLYWRGFNNLYYYNPSFTDKASSIAVYNDTNYTMIIHFNEHGNYSGRKLVAEIDSYRNWTKPDLRLVNFSNIFNNWDNRISAVIWKWF